MCEIIGIRGITDYPDCISERFGDFRFFCSCDGFVWIGFTYNSGIERYYIWNPTTKVCKEIPMGRKVNSRDIGGYGFGYDYKTGDYKLVRVVQGSRCSKADVYRLRSKTWNRSQSSIPYYCYYDSHYGVRSNGALHWLACTFDEDSVVLVGFDIVNERFEDVALPEEPFEKGYDKISVGVLGGCLCLVFQVDNVRVDVWIMQDYGERESWTKSFSITEEIIVSKVFVDLLWSFKNNESLWLVDGDYILYDPNNNRYKVMTFCSSCSAAKVTLQNYMDI